MNYYNYKITRRYFPIAMENYPIYMQLYPVKKAAKVILFSLMGELSSWIMCFFGKDLIFRKLISDPKVTALIGLKFLKNYTICRY
jgi:hypothetical protein